MLGKIFIGIPIDKTVFRFENLDGVKQKVVDFTQEKKLVILTFH